MIKWEELNEHLDWPAITRAIAGKREQNLFTNPADAKAKSMVIRALSRWAARDFNIMSLKRTEEHFDFPDPLTGDPLSHGYIDITLELLRPYKTFVEKYVGKTFVTDWKTTSGALDAVWHDRLSSSWQGKLYAVAKGCTHVIYRGIAQNPDTGEREVIFELPPPEQLLDQVLHQFRAYQRQLKDFDAHTTETNPTWSRHMPYACGAYGRKCPYKTDCDTNSSPFIIFPPEVIAKPLSYSSGERFALCPEKQRRYLAAREGLDPTVLVAEEDQEDTDETNLGLAVHRGLEEAYKQLQIIQEKGTLSYAI